MVAERDALASSNDILTISAKNLSDMLKGSLNSKYPVISFDVEEQFGDLPGYSLDVHVSYGKLSTSDDYKNCFEKAQSDFSSILSNICKMENLVGLHFSANNGALIASVYKTETKSFFANKNL